jgi:hypothetical protein
MNKVIDEEKSLALATQIKSKARKPFDNAYQAALTTEGAVYVQGFLAVPGQPYQPIEHAWIEVDNCILDPSLPYLNRKAQDLTYFAAQQLTVKQLKAAIEEAREDYPEDDPLPIYGVAPYEYYGDVMLGGKAYMDAYSAAEQKCREMTQQDAERN